MKEPVRKPLAQAVSEQSRDEQKHQRQMQAAELTANAVIGELEAQRNNALTRCTQLAAEVMGYKVALEQANNQGKQIAGAFATAQQELETLRVRIAEMEKAADIDTSQAAAVMEVPADIEKIAAKYEAREASKV